MASGGVAMVSLGGWAGFRSKRRIGSREIHAVEAASAGFSGDWLVSPYTTEVDNLRNAHTDMFLSFTSLTSAEYLRVPVPLRGHACLRHPLRPATVVLFPKFGDLAVEISLGHEPELRRVAATSEAYFYGHGIFSPAGDVLFETEVMARDRRGIISLRDPSDYRELGRFESGGVSPHDLKLSTDGRHLIVANGNKSGSAKASVTTLDIASGKILERIESPEDNATFAHLVLADSDRDLLVATTPHEEFRPGRVYARREDGPIEVLPIPDEILSQLRGQALSLAVQPEQAICGVTYPDCDRALFWNYRERRFLGEVPLLRPTGFVLAPDGRHFLAVQRTAAVQAIDTTTLQPVEHPLSPLLAGNVSHASLLAFQK